MTQFQYSPLDPQSPSQIRLLHLLPGRWTSHIACTLTTTSLDETPPPTYEAISYVWGDPKDYATTTTTTSTTTTTTHPYTITLNGHPCTISPNLHIALRRLRRASSSAPPRTLWADAVCINQRDLEEKRRQIGIMDRIYKGAACVQVFLGESGVLDVVGAEEQEMWGEEGEEEGIWWERDLVVLVQSRKAPVAAAGRTSASLLDAISDAFRDGDPTVSDSERVDPREYPMWQIIDPVTGIKHQHRIDAFWDRQRNLQYEPSRLTPIEALRTSQADAFAIMKLLSNGRCLKQCLAGEPSNPAWTNALRSLHHLTQLPWWSRVWVLQESLLNPNVTMHYGEITAPIDLIESAGAMLPRHYRKGECCRAMWNSLPSDQQRILDEFAAVMDNLEGIRAWRRHTYHEQPLELLLYLHRTRMKKATDPRDRIYGLLGLINHCSSPMGLVADYTKDVCHVYTDLAIKMMAYHQNLFLLLNHEVKGLIPSLPSWVPHWGECFSTVSDYLIGERLRNYSSWPPGPGELPRLIDNYALEVMASKVDSITEIIGPFSRSDTSGHHLSNIIDDLSAFFGVDNDPFAQYPGSNLTLHDAFWRTLCGDLLASTSVAYIHEQTIFTRASAADVSLFTIAHAVWKHNVAATAVTRDTTDTTNATTNSPPHNLLFVIKQDGTLMSTEEMEHKAQTAADNFWYANERKVFFKTARGYFGAGPPGTRVGDGVWLVFGCSAPVVLRAAAAAESQGGQMSVSTTSTSSSVSASVVDKEMRRNAHLWFQLVGYTFVQGIMDGERAPGERKVRAAYARARSRRAGATRRQRVVERLVGASRRKGGAGLIYLV